MVNTILQILLIAAIMFVGYMLRDLPKLYRERNVENLKSENAHDLQRESYFRQISGNDLKDIFDEWLMLFLDMDKQASKFNDTEVMVKLIEKTMICGSTKTFGICSEMMRYIYISSAETKKEQDTKQKIKQDKNANNYHGCVMILFITNIVSSLKFDFTGYTVLPETIIQSKINDFETQKNLDYYKKAEKYVNDMIKKYN